MKKWSLYLLPVVTLLGTFQAQAHGPVRQKLAETIQINASPESVWEKIKDFGNMSWLPAVESTQHNGGDSKGATRVLTLKTGESITEELKKYNPAKMSYSYKITDMTTVGSIFHSGIDEPIKVIPVTDYSATIEVKAKGNGSEVKWKSGFYRGYMNNNPPEALNEAAAISAVQNIFRAGLESLKNLAESNNVAIVVNKKPEPKKIKTKPHKVTSDTEYPAANFQPQVIFIDKQTTAAFNPKYPAAYFEPKVIFFDNNKKTTAVFDPKYPAAHFEPKVIYP